MQRYIETNIFEGQIPESLQIKTLALPVPSISDTDLRSEFFKLLHSTVRMRANGYHYGDTVYFLGDTTELIEDLQQNLSRKYRGLSIGAASETELKLSNMNDLQIIRNLLYLQFERLVADHGYAVRFRRARDKVAIPSFEELQSQAGTLKLVELLGYPTATVVDSFFYRLNLKPNGYVSLTIDPKVQVLLPLTSAGTTELSRAYISTICFSDSDRNQRCPLLRQTSVRFLNSSPKPNFQSATKCAQAARGYSLVLDPKRNQNIILPNNILYLEANPANYRQNSRVRTRSLKHSDERRNLTVAFAAHLADGTSEIRVPFGGTQIGFSSAPKLLELNSLTEEISSFDYAKSLTEPLLNVTNSPMYVRPMDALTKEGPYSRNNSGTGLFHPNPIVLHVIFSANSKLLVDGLISGLQEGIIGFAGIKGNSSPFFSDITIIPYPIRPALVDYKSTISAIKEKIEVKGHVVVAVLPDELTAYWDLKNLCLQHNIPSQFVREASIRTNQSALSFFLWNLAIAIYAKAGGTPWKIDSSLLQFSECYVGIQTKTIAARYVEEKVFFVGAADIFNSFGEFISCAAYQDRSKTYDGLHVDREFMKNLIERTLSRYYAVVKFYPSTIVFHRHIRFNQEEIEGLIDGLRQANVNCRCILVHLQEGHHFRGYSTEAGADGDITIDRSIYYPLTRHSVVLFVTGRAEGRYEGKLGTPKPTQVNVTVVNSEKDVTIQEIESICKSILGFTRLHWNTTRIGIRSPLTLFAANQIGELAKNGFTGFEFRDIRDFL